jgi:hypothetical protein
MAVEAGDVLRAHISVVVFLAAVELGNEPLAYFSHPVMGCNR